MRLFFLSIIKFMVICIISFIMIEHRHSDNSYIFKQWYVDDILCLISLRYDINFTKNFLAGTWAGWWDKWMNRQTNERWVRTPIWQKCWNNDMLKIFCVKFREDPTLTILKTTLTKNFTWAGRKDGRADWQAYRPKNYISLILRMPGHKNHSFGIRKCLKVLVW